MQWLVKEVMFGLMEVKTRRGRPCREWLDDIRGGVERKFTYSAEQLCVRNLLEVPTQ